MAEAATLSSSEAVRDRASTGDAPEREPAREPEVKPEAPRSAFGDVSERLRSTMDEYRGARERISAGQRDYATELAPAIQAARQSIEGRGNLPQPPIAPQLKPPPSRKLTDFLAPVEGEAPEQSISKMMQALGQLAMGLGVGGKKDARAALAAWAGALKGWQEGDKQRADRSFADWQANTDKALTQWKVDRTAFEDIIKAADMSMEDKFRLINLLKLEREMKAAPDVTDAETYQAMIGMLDKQQQHADSLALEMSKILDRRWEKEADRALRLDIFLQTDATRKEVARIFNEGRTSIRREIPVPGEWFDRQSGERAYPTREDYLSPDFKERFHKSNPSGVTRYEQISIALPMVKKLRVLSDRLLADHPVENLVRALELSAQGKVASNPDLREWQAQVEDVNVKMTSIMGPGQFRVTLMRVLREVGLHTRDTKATAARVLDQWETNIDNDLRAITGQKLREHISGPWQGWALSPAGERKWVRIPKGERIEPGWITVEETQ